MIFLKQQKKKKAVAYYRRSTRDMQEYSIPIQREEAQKFAAKYGIEIIHEEEDKDSGVTAERPGFQRLMNDWVNKRDSIGFDYIFVKDDSRWGRFQKKDEAGHYEYLCNENGIEVVYFSEGFPIEGEGNQMLTGLQRTVKREMASEFSRKLSRDVFGGMIKISSEGYSVGGTACYGMNRLLLDERKKPVKILKHGEHKGLANDRIRFIPSDDEKSKAVQDIFFWFVDELKSPEEIATNLNKSGLTAPNGKEWNKSKVIRILGNETYIGTRLYNKTSNNIYIRARSKSKKGHRKNPRSEWVICQNAFPALINPERFWLAQEYLYWMLPSKNRRGFFILQKTKRSVQADIQEVLKQEGMDSEYARFLPLSFAVKRTLPDQTPYWCFFISRPMREHKNVLCVSVDMDKSEADSAFLIPTSAFNIIGMCLFSEVDELYARTLQKEEDTEKTLLSLLKSFLNT
jgi:DNA invertase Pin-like site-specific DNA recombinase